MKAKILIVDDDPIIVTILEEQLSRAGYTTTSVSDGQQAMDSIGQENPDLIISDIMMPRMDGYELHRRLRKDPHTASIPFVFLTAKTEPSDQLEGLRMGADDYVCKPFQIHDLIDRVEKVLERAAKAKTFNLRADFSGNVAQMSLTDILQIVELNHKTGHLLFKNQRGTKIGELFFKDGQLINAHAGSLEGEEAFYELMGQRDGIFEFFGKQIEEERKISAGNMTVLLNGSRLVDEGRELDDLVEDFEQRLEIKSKSIDSEITDKLGKDSVNVVLAMIEDGAGVNQIVYSKKMSRWRAQSILAALIKFGNVLLKKEASRGRIRIDPILVNEIRKRKKNESSGVLKISGLSEKAAIFFENGRIIHAFFGAAIAQKALFRIFSRPEASFEFIEEPVSVARTIAQDVEKLIELGKIELEKISRLPSNFFENDVQIDFEKLSGVSKKVREKKGLKQILSLAQQYDTIGDIVNASKITDLATCKILSELIKKKLLRVSAQGDSDSTRVQLITDSAIDLPPYLLENLDIKIIPFTITANSKTYRDGPRLSSELFYRELLSQNGSPSASAPNSDAFENVFRDIVPRKDILAILSSSAITGAFDNAMAALRHNRDTFVKLRQNERGAFKAPQIEIVDSKTATGGLGLVLLEAAEKLEKGWPLEQTLGHVEKLLSQCRTYLIADNPQYLLNSGAVMSLGRDFSREVYSKAIFGVSDGRIVLIEPGSSSATPNERVVENISKDLEKNDQTLLVAISHGDAQKKAEKLKNLLELNFDCARILVSTMGPVLGCVCGPQALSITYIPLGL